MQRKIMQIAIGAICLIAGIILLVRAHDMAHAFGEQVQQAFTGAPSNRATYFQIAGVALTIFGAVEIFLGVKPKSKP
jgi:TRAP-type C4-dicarboxylate transport system permease small subunit